MTTSSTAIIVALHGQENQLRTAANHRAMRQWVLQEPPVNIYIEELLFPGDNPELYAPALRELESQHNVIHTQTMATDSNRDIFHKETLWNRQARKAISQGNEVLMFWDADIWSEDRLWWQKIRDKIMAESQDVVVQGFSYAIQDGEPLFRSLASVQDPDFKSQVDIGGAHSGYNWSMRSTAWQKINGFNEWLITGTGDIGFIIETLSPEFVLTPELASEWIYAVLRTRQPKMKLCCVDVPVIHENHGTGLGRSYMATRKVIDFMGVRINELVHKDKQGVLAWIDPNNKLRLVLREREAMQDSYYKMVETCQKYGIELPFNPGLKTDFDHSEYGTSSTSHPTIHTHTPE